MHPLRNITLNDHLFKKYTKYHPFFCSAGGEGITHFFFSLKRGPIARKIITPHMSYSFLGKQAFEQVCENKWEKTKKIYERNPDNAVKILATLSYRGNFVGYDTSWDPRAFSLKQYETEKRWKSEEEKIFYLSQIPQKLEHFHELGIVFGDVRDGNILLNPVTQTISFCDLDNTQVDQHQIDILYYLIESFQNQEKLISDTADTWMYNVLFIKLMSSLEKEGQVFARIQYKNKIGYLQERAYPFLDQMNVSFKTGEYKGPYLHEYIKQK